MTQMAGSGFRRRPWSPAHRAHRQDAPAPQQSYVLVPQALGLALLAYAAVPHNAAKAAEEQQDEQAAPAKDVPSENHRSPKASLHLSDLHSRLRDWRPLWF